MKYGLGLYIVLSNASISACSHNGESLPRTVLITGASSGYGKATANLFLEHGWNVIATMRRPEPDVFAAGSDRLTVLPLDVTDDGASTTRSLPESPPMGDRRLGE